MQSKKKNRLKKFRRYTFHITQKDLDCLLELSEIAEVTTASMLRGLMRQSAKDLGPLKKSWEDEWYDELYAIARLGSSLA